MKWVGAIVALLLVFIAYLYLQGGINTQRFRLTIDIETPEGIKSGSSVIETSTWESGGWGPTEAQGIRRSFRGRAVFVDLGGGKNLVALLAFGSNGRDQTKLFELARAALAPGRTADWQEEYRLKGAGVLPPDYTPTLITFADLANPKTASVVYRSELGKVFGPGFRFLQARLETTTEPVSHSIEKILPWWNLPGRPAEQAYRAWLQGSTDGPSLEPELLFRKD